MEAHPDRQLLAPYAVGADDKSLRRSRSTTSYAITQGIHSLMTFNKPDITMVSQLHWQGHPQFSMNCAMAWAVDSFKEHIDSVVIIPACAKAVCVCILISFICQFASSLRVVDLLLLRSLVLECDM